MALGVALAFVTILGMVGFTRYEEAAGAVQPITTRLYLSLQLFVLESGSVSGSLPWELDVARYAAPIVGAYALIRALAVVLHEQVDVLRLRLVSDHVVVAGLGRKGALLAQALLDRGDRVVAIEIDSGNPELQWMRAMGGLVVIGDARHPGTLQRAGAGRARQLVVLCGDDGSNVEVVARAREVAGGRRPGSLNCIAHVANPELGRLLCIEELERFGEAPVRVDFVNVHAAAAQALLSAHPPGGTDEGASRLAIVGAGRTARHLLLALARSRGSGGRQDGRPLIVTTVGPDVGTLAHLRERHPEIARFADVRVVPDLAHLLEGGAPAVVYVCPDDDQAAASAALDLRGLLAGQPARIVVVLEARAGLGRLLEGARQPAGGPTLITFGMLEETCRPEVLLTGTIEILARAMHAAYLEAAGEGAAQDDPAQRPWSELPETLQESNRDQAAHVAVKLAAVGLGIAPLTDWSAAQQPFCESDVEVMSRLEHVRWMAERRRAGWRPGPRDTLHRTTPYLVPWEQLSEEIRDRDRLFIRRLPGMLASAGLQTVRRNT